LLTRDNLIKRQWKGSKKCCFCDAEKSIEHLFLSCPLSKIVWRIVFSTYNIPPPTNIKNMFGNWLNGIDKETKSRIRIGVSALCWAIWRSRNNVVFNNANNSNFLQVIHMATQWIQDWSLLLPVDQRDHMLTGCNRLLTVTRDFYNQAIWRLSRRLTDV
jgi:hypothetical protein